MDENTLGLDRPILITGCARSGTSMVAGIINICGAWGGQMSGATKYNKRGMFENAEIRNDVVKPFLKANGWDPLGQHPLADIDTVRGMDKSEAMRLRRRVVGIIKKQGYKGGPWFYKGAKMASMWPLWHTAFPSARWVVVRRADADIVNSCMKTSFMRAHKQPDGWYGWVDAHIARFAEMKDEGLDLQQVWPQKIVNGKFRQIRDIVEELGLYWDRKRVWDFVTPALWSSGVIPKIMEVQDGK